jgi:hypothetical protein
MVRKVLLVCGFFSSLLNTTVCVFVPMLYEGYSSVSQTVSKLYAHGAPARKLWILLCIHYTLIVTAFGWRVWPSARGNHALRITLNLPRLWVAVMSIALLCEFDRQGEGGP